MAFFDGLHSPVLSRFRIPGVVLLAGGMIGSIVAAGVAHQLLRPHRYVLTLDASPRCGALYFSAFGEAPVVTDHANDGKPITFKRTFTWEDGCDWQAVEQLTPVANGYRYHYDEHFVACPAGLQPYGVPSPLDGFVHARRIAEDRAAVTPLEARFGTTAYEE